MCPGDRPAGPPADGDAALTEIPHVGRPDHGAQVENSVSLPFRLPLDKPFLLILPHSSSLLPPPSLSPSPPSLPPSLPPFLLPSLPLSLPPSFPFLCFACSSLIEAQLRSGGVPSKAVQLHRDLVSLSRQLESSRCSHLRGYASSSVQHWGTS